jgi:hypothetical protein
VAEPPPITLSAAGEGERAGGEDEQVREGALLHVQSVRGDDPVVRAVTASQPRKAFYEPEPTTAMASISTRKPPSVLPTVVRQGRCALRMQLFLRHGFLLGGHRAA